MLIAVKARNFAIEELFNSKCLGGCWGPRKVVVLYWITGLLCLLNTARKNIKRSLRALHFSVSPRSAIRHTWNLVGPPIDSTITPPSQNISNHHRTFPSLVLLLIRQTSLSISLSCAYTCNEGCHLCAIHNDSFCRVMVDFCCEESIY